MQYRGTTRIDLDITEAVPETLQGQYRDITKAVPGHGRERPLHFTASPSQYSLSILSNRGGQTDQFRNPHFSSQHEPCINKTTHFFTSWLLISVHPSVSILQRPSLMCTKPPPPTQVTCAMRAVATHCLHPELPAEPLNKSQTSAQKYSRRLFRTNAVSNPKGTVCHL
jgi:hypothetical protein